MFFFYKGTVDKISNEPPWQQLYTRFTTLPFKPLTRIKLYFFYLSRKKDNFKGLLLRQAPINNLSICGVENKDITIIFSLLKV